MNAKKLAITTVATGLLCSLGVWSAKSLSVSTFKTETLKSTQIQKIPGNHVLFDSIEEIEKYTDLIVIGRTTKELGEGKPIVTNTPMGGIEDFYTITSFEVKNVLKGAIASNTIQVLQPAVLINESSKQSLLIREDYSLLKRNSFYLLFLAQVKGGGYSIISINQGKFSLDKKAQQEQVIEKQNLQYATLKAKALSKYYNKILK